MDLTRDKNPKNRISVARDNPANPHDQSSNDRNQKEEERDELQTKEPDNDHGQRKRRHKISKIRGIRRRA